MVLTESVKTSGGVFLTFSDKGRSFKKFVRTTGVDHSVWGAIIKAIKEAERDIAFAEYGDEWRNHLRVPPCFSGKVDPERQELIRDILKAIGVPDGA